MPKIRMVILVLAALVVVALVAATGDLARVADVRIRHARLLAAALVGQVVVINVVAGAVPASVAAAVHLGTYALAIAFLVLNRHIRWLWLLGSGGLMNLTAIVANGGVMPASPRALEAAGKALDASHFTNSTAVAGARLQFLGDVFWVPESLPLANVFSVGDVVLVAGLALVLRGVCRVPSPAPA